MLNNWISDYMVSALFCCIYSYVLLYFEIQYAGYMPIIVQCGDIIGILTTKCKNDIISE